MPCNRAGVTVARAVKIDGPFIKCRSLVKIRAMEPKANISYNECGLSRTTQILKALTRPSKSLAMPTSLWMFSRFALAASTAVMAASAATLA